MESGELKWWPKTMFCCTSCQHSIFASVKGKLPGRKLLRLLSKGPSNQLSEGTGMSATGGVDFNTWTETESIHAFPGPSSMKVTWNGPLRGAAR